MTKPAAVSISTATWLGYLGLVFWAISAVLVVTVKSLPIFEIMSVSFLISFILASSIITYKKQWHKLKQPWFLWVIGIVGIYGNDVLYIAAFKHAPPVQVDIISYLWPMLIILFAGFIPTENLTFKHILAATVGFFGVYILLTEGKGISGFSVEYLFGYLFAFLGALVWSVYTVVVRKYGKTPPEIIGLYCGVCMLMSVGLHFQFEEFVMPTLLQWTVLAMMGLTVQGLAYFLWELGVKRGNFKLLSVLSYGNPILSIALLIVFGFAKPSWFLLWAVLLVSIAGVIATLKWDKFLPGIDVSAKV